MNTTWIMKVPARPEKPMLNIPANQIERVNAVMLFRAASGLGLRDAYELININFPITFPPDQHSHPNTLNMQPFRDFIAAWREANLRGFV